MAIEKIPIGKMRDVGHFENNSNRQPATAGYLDGYETFVTSVYCWIEQRTHRRVNEYGEIKMIGFWEMQCRFQSAIDGNIKVGTKFVVGNDRFQVIGFSIIDRKNFQYHFTLELAQ